MTFSASLSTAVIPFSQPLAQLGPPLLYHLWCLVYLQLHPQKNTRYRGMMDMWGETMMCWGCAPALPRLPSPISITPMAPWMTGAAPSPAISSTVTTVQRAGPPEEKEHLQSRGLAVQNGSSLASPHPCSQGAGRQHNTDQPLHEMKRSSALEKCKVKGREPPARACCDRPHIVFIHIPLWSHSGNQDIYSKEQ